MRFKSTNHEKTLRRFCSNKYKPPQSLDDILMRFCHLSLPQFILIIVARHSSKDTFDFEYIYRNLEEYMAQNKFDWEFVNISLVEEDRPAIKALADEYKGFTHDAIADINELGYKVTINYIVDQNSYIVTVSGQKEEGLNVKKSVTTWSNDLQECVFMAAYKILVLTKSGDWSEYAVKTDKWG